MNATSITLDAFLLNVPVQLLIGDAPHTASLSR